MKNVIRFKTVFLSTIFGLALLFSVVACNNPTPTTTTSEDSKKVAEEGKMVKMDAMNKEKDAQFLVSAAEINLEEIKLGQLAQQSSTMKDVKGLGKMMQDDHTKAYADLTTLAGKKMVTIPTVTGTKADDDYKMLAAIKGKNFDKAYCDKMVNGHKDAIALFEKASTECTDTDIKQWAAATLPTLRMHLDHSTMCQKECEKMSKM